MIKSGLYYVIQSFRQGTKLHLQTTIMAISLEMLMTKFFPGGGGGGMTQDELKISPITELVHTCYTWIKKKLVHTCYTWILVIPG